MTVVPYRDRDRPVVGQMIEPPRDWVAVAELAKSIAGTDFVPAALRDNPAAITAAILYGDEIGLRPMRSLAMIAVINGRPTLAAEAQRALIQAAGHEIWLEESTTTKATWSGRRNGSDQTTRVTWTLDDAKRAGIAGKQNWRMYPRQMLSARASAELARAMFADAIGGLAATEELQDDPAAGEPTPAPEPAPRSRTRRRALPVSDQPEAPPAGVEQPPRPGEQPEEPAAEGARRRMHALFREAGIEGRPDRLAYTNEVLEREITTSTEMTASEVQQVSSALAAETGRPHDGQDEADISTGPAVVGATSDAGPASPTDEPYDERREHLAATDAQKQRLDELVAGVLEHTTTAIGDLWVQVAVYRRMMVEPLIAALGGRDPTGRLVWEPLRDGLRRDEAGDLVDHLAALRPDDIPY